MPDTCCVPNCTGHTGTEKQRFFSPPKDDAARKKWERNIPRMGPLKKSNKVCDLHFEEADIVKGNTLVVNGENVILPWKQWRLVEGAVPRLFPNCPVYLSKPTKRRKEPRQRSLPSKRPKNSGVQDESITDQQEHGNPQNNGSPDHADQLESTENKPKMDIKNVQLPQTWSWVVNDYVIETFDTTEELCCSEIVRSQDGIIRSKRSLEVNLACGAIRYFLYGLLLTILPEEYKSFTSCGEQLTEILRRFNEATLCPGFPTSLVPPASSKLCHNDGRFYRSTKCTGVSDFSKLCPNCRSLKTKIKKSVKRLRNKSNKKALKKYVGPSMQTKLMARKLYAANKRVKSRENKIAKYKGKVKALMHKVSQANETALQTAIGKLDSKEQLAVRTIFQNSSAFKKSKYGRRYEAEWLLECLLLRIKSRTTYEHLRSRKLLSLPHPDTLQNLLSCFPCTFGFNEFTLHGSNSGSNGQIIIIRFFI